VAAWHSVASLVLINEVNLCWARFVLGWVTVPGFDSWRRHFILACNQPPRSTQRSTLCGTVKWVPAKGRWCSAAGEQRQAWCNLQVKLCDPCLSALEVVTTMRYANWRILYFTWLLPPPAPSLLFPFNGRFFQVNLGELVTTCVCFPPVMGENLGD